MTEYCVHDKQKGKKNPRLRKDCDKCMMVDESYKIKAEDLE